MRFDDSLSTVLSAETESGMGAQAAWRQLVDLIGRGRVPADEAALERLHELRAHVSVSVRAASARALAFATPPEALVAFFGEDRLDIAAPVLRTAILSGLEWTRIVPRLSPAGRSVLRHRRDLPVEASLALESFGPTDFVLEFTASENAEALTPALVDSVVEVQRELPTVPEALPSADAPAPEAPRFEIADLVARIDAFQRERERAPAEPKPTPAPADAFRFETDGSGTICWVDGVVPTPLVGVSLAHAALQGQAQVEGGIAGAYRRRSAFRDARLAVGGTSDASGGWRLSGVPAFDPATGRFLGYRGNARRPRPDESATPRRSTGASDSLRQLVHELRTPTNAIAGFAELIETELLGPVADPYRYHAGAIRGQASTLIQAIDDLDTAARLDGGALELRPAAVDLAPLLARAVADLQPLADLRAASVGLEGDVVPPVRADDRALERLVARLLSALLSLAEPGERLRIVTGHVGKAVTLAIDKPAAFDRADEVAEREGAPLLGFTFALKLAANLAVELGGGLVIDGERLTLRLPAAVDQGMQASTN